MRTWTCEESRNGLSNFLAAECGRPEANLLQAHLAQCDACTRHAEEVLWQDRALAELFARARLDQMAQRVSSALGSLDQVSVDDSGSLFRSRRLVAAAAAVLLVAGSAMVAWLWPSRPVEVVRQKERVDAGPHPEPKRNASVPQVPSDLPLEPEPEPPPPVVPDSNPPPVPKLPPAVAKAVPATAPEKKVETPTMPEAPPKLPAEARDSSKLPSPEKSPQPIEILPPKTVDNAIARGVTFLRLRSPKLEFARGGGREPRAEELVLWTYFMVGVPENDPEFVRLLKGVLERKLERTYDTALQAMLLEEMDRVKYQGRLHQCAQFLADNQCKNGQWSYGDPSLFVDEIASMPLPPPPAGGAKPAVKEFPPSGTPLAREKPVVKRRIAVVKRREGPDAGDNSNSMYAALGLRACADAGIFFPGDVLRNAERAWRDAFNGEGWCYGPKGHNHKAYGSMTSGGVGSLVIYDYLLGRDWKRDLEVGKGLAWLAKNFSVTSNPGPYEHAIGTENTLNQYYYFLYALERAGVLYGTEKMGTHEWYKEGSQVLLDNQRIDGAWMSKEAGNELNDTCFALLFLRRATRGLPPPVATGK